MKAEFTRLQMELYFLRLRENIHHSVFELYQQHGTGVTSKQVLDAIMQEESPSLPNYKPVESNLPFKSEAFLEAWSEFEDLRKKKRMILTDRAKHRILNKLYKFPEETAVNMVMQSNDKGWTGVFEVREFKKQNTSLSAKQQQSDFHGKF